MKFGRFFRRYGKANIRKFSRGVRTGMYGVFRVKTERNFNRQVQSHAKRNAPESKHLQLPARTDRRSLKTTTLDANWNTLTGLFLAFYRRQPYKCFTVNLPICLI